MASGALILMYHRVTNRRPDPWELCVAPNHFTEQLDVLSRLAHPLRLRDLVRALQRGSLPPRAVVVTFDDGYAGNLHQARPLLERYVIPATFFLITGQIGSGQEFWWDQIEQVLLQPGTLPGALNLTIEGTAHRWELGDAAHYNEDASRRDRLWCVWDPVAPSARHVLYRQLHELLYPLPQEPRARALEDLFAWAGAERALRPSHRILSSEEVLTLARGGLVDVGAHTVTHSLLPALPASAQHEEVRQSRLFLEELLGRPVTSFSYPYLRCTEETAAIVRDAGFVCACAGSNALVRLDADPLRLPRMHVQDWDGTEFARRLEGWFSEQPLG